MCADDEERIVKWKIDLSVLLGADSPPNQPSKDKYVQFNFSKEAEENIENNIHDQNLHSSWGETLLISTHRDTLKMMHANYSSMKNLINILIKQENV